MNTLKRKAELDKDEDDDWEKEAGHLANKRARNTYESHLNLMDQHHKNLLACNEEAENRLIELEKELTQYETEETETIQSVEQLKKENDMLSQQLTEARKQEKLDKEHGTLKMKEYSEKDKDLTALLTSVLDSWQSILEKEEEVNDTDVELEDLVHSYKTTEFDIIDLTAQVEGYRKRISSLNHYTKSVSDNSSVLSDLTEEIDTAKEKIVAANNLLEDMERDTVRPYLVELANHKINHPQKQLQMEQDSHLMEDLLHDINLVYELAFKQRAQQQLVRYLSDEWNKINEL
ncbi:hypothetical protein BY458DRAFT_184990 [Sporodiniella umbellata]|nr:hypothetical protein BY458DRAFT_184990 [Sporodiniella umbellata]